MENFDYQRRTFILFGRGRENEAGSLVKYEGGRRVLCVYGSEARIREGLMDRIRRSLDRSGLECFDFELKVSMPLVEEVYRGISTCRELQIDFILAIGNSALFDCAKAIAAGALYAGDFLDFFMGLREPINSLALGCVVTNPDAGSECSASCEVHRITKGRVIKLHKASYTFLPRFAILNPELSLNMKPQNAAVCCMDMLAHVIGCYFSNTPNVELTDELCEGILRTITQMLPRVVENPADYDAWANIMLAGTLAQNGMCSLGREVDWSYVLLEHELVSNYPCNHGHALAVLLPAWMSYCLGHNVMRMAQFGMRIFGIGMNFDEPEVTALAGIDAFRNFLASVGLPQNFRDMGLPTVNIPRLVTSLNLKKNETIGSYVKLDSQACEVIYTIANTYHHDKWNQGKYGFRWA